MSTWNSAAGRGSDLEAAVNQTNEQYLLYRLALVQKIPTPIVPLEIDGSGRITRAFFEQKSTVDYIGLVQGVPVCFDAKECTVRRFPLKNVAAHQIRFMEDFEAQGGISFLLLRFVSEEGYHYLRFEKLRHFLRRAEEGGRKSIAPEELEEDFFFGPRKGLLVPWLDALQKDLTIRDEIDEGTRAAADPGGSPGRAGGGM